MTEGKSFTRRKYIDVKKSNHSFIAIEFTVCAIVNYCFANVVKQSEDFYVGLLRKIFTKEDLYKPNEITDVMLISSPFSLHFDRMRYRLKI